MKSSQTGLREEARKRKKNKPAEQPEVLRKKLEQLISVTPPSDLETIELVFDAFLRKHHQSLARLTKEREG